MTNLKKVFYLLASIAAIMFLPYAGSWVHYGGPFPEHFFAYPPLEPQPPAKTHFNQTIFILIAILFIVVVVFYLFPRIFGFKKQPRIPARKPDKVALPIWFWAGLIMWGGSIVLLWGKFSEPRWLLHWSDLPLFWGMTLIVDGWVYVRNGGKSIISHAPREMVGMGMASVSGWMIFEYLNFFVDENWYYPKGWIIPNTEFLLYAIIGSSGLMPMAFEWFSLLKTFPNFRNRYAAGPKVRFPGWLQITLLIAGLGGMFASGLFPDGFFFTLWVSPMVIIGVVLARIDVWTPFTPLRDGNWAPLVTFSLTYLIQGVLMEGWNYFSAIHDSAGHVVFTEAPAYWVYDIPYVDVHHLFEMPLLGYLGYIPFGVYCWIWWISFGWILDVPSQFYTDSMSQD